MTRRVFFLGLIAYGLLTGLFYRIINLIDRVGWTDAAVYVFSISVIVWVAVYIGLELIIEADDDESVGKLDEAVGITGLLLCSIPYAPLAWLGYYPNRLVGDHHRAANHAASRRTDFARNHVSNAVELSDLQVLVGTHSTSRCLDRRQATWNQQRGNPHRLRG